MENATLVRVIPVAHWSVETGPDLINLELQVQRPTLNSFFINHRGQSHRQVLTVKVKADGPFRLVLTWTS